MMASVDTKQRSASLPGVERGLFVAKLIRREESMCQKGVRMSTCLVTHACRLCGTVIHSWIWWNITAAKS
ncbi:hypothetical protein OPV22_030079 [Ensete ventricosum]|uniref:Yippee domain-containing protein n=1 Tax=Ensete ventricosum TaxID=4639 RepID=A0AAV8Q2V2_ENSVE|nr:hypothetical protein OPV22_030079 [Ensete ventricosum]